MAILLTEGYSYSGVKGDIQVWNPHVESDDEYSTSQVSLKSGPYYDFESVEAGWAVSKTLLIRTVFDLHNSKLNNCILFCCLCAMSSFSSIKSDYPEHFSTLQVNPSVYGDRKTRLFVYWTVSSSKAYLVSRKLYIKRNAKHYLTS